LFGPNIFLKIFLSNTNSLLIMVSFNIHVRQFDYTVFMSSWLPLMCT
jgi:hypothetical protein